MARKTVTFKLDTEADRDLVRWLDGLPKRKRSEAIRGALRDSLGRGGVTIGDVYQIVKALERKLQAGAVAVAPAPAAGSDEQEEAPPDVLAALDSLGL